MVRQLVSMAGSLLSVALVTLTLSGCGGGTDKGPKLVASTSGKLTYKNMPVTNATVSFSNPKIGSYGVPVKDDGSYSIDKMAEGDFLVTVAPITAQNSMELPKNGKLAAPAERPDIPKKYRTAVEGTGRVVIKAGSNTHDIDMKD